MSIIFKNNEINIYFKIILKIDCLHLFVLIIFQNTEISKILKNHF